MADALDVNVADVVLAAARSIGLDVSRGADSELAAMLPASAVLLSVAQRDAILALVRSITQVDPAAGSGGFIRAAQEAVGVSRVQVGPDSDSDQPPSPPLSFELDSVEGRQLVAYLENAAAIATSASESLATLFQRGEPTLPTPAGGLVTMCADLIDAAVRTFQSVGEPDGDSLEATRIKEARQSVARSAEWLHVVPTLAAICTQPPSAEGIAAVQMIERLLARLQADLAAFTANPTPDNIDNRLAEIRDEATSQDVSKLTRLPDPSRPDRAFAARTRRADIPVGDPDAYENTIGEAPDPDGPEAGA